MTQMVLLLQDSKLLDGVLPWYLGGQQQMGGLPSATSHAELHGRAGLQAAACAG